ncbi:MAG: aromatic/alkene monooxygenase hydroxylase subunit beta [Panacagrimonas sp.]
MSDTDVLKPLKTWSHLAARRRKPSEYEVVSVNLHYNTRPGADPYELDPNMHMNRWYKKYRDGSPLQHDNWNAYRDPDELIYRTYTMLQDGAETYVYGLLNQFNEREHDKALSPQWAGTLARLYTPGRYLFHTVQMTSAYIAQIAPASTISLTAAFQGMDSFRSLSHTAYRAKELSDGFPDRGFGRDERHYWEDDAAWQGFRELMEKTMATYDWAECYVALNLVAKPAIDEAVLRKLGEAGRHNNDTLLGMMTDAELVDGARHRRQAAALVKMVCEKPGNADVIKGWIAKWEPLADQAIDAFCAALPDVANAAEAAKQATRDYRRSLAGL